jgi:hypothetical protein
MTKELINPVLDVPYRTGPLARTDIHAGGVFFCVVYREFLQFSSGGRVRRWCEVIDDSRPLDDEPAELRATDVMGSYRTNERGYLECLFPNLELIGLPCEQAPGILAFHAFRARPGVSFSLVYASRVAEAELGGAANRSQPVGSETNRTSSAAGSGG